MCSEDKDKSEEVVTEELQGAFSSQPRVTPHQKRYFRCMR